MTYALLLRPHREIRCLTVGDFNEDFSLLSLDGERVKSKKNRKLPVPSFVQEELRERFQDCDDAVNYSQGDVERTTEITSKTDGQITNVRRI